MSVSLSLVALVIPFSLRFADRISLCEFAVGDMVRHLLEWRVTMLD